MDKNHQKNTTREFVVEKDSLLLDYLFTLFPDSPKKRVKDMLVHGQVRVNGVVKTRHDTQLSSGQVITLSKTGSNFKKIETPLEIIYEDDEIIAINKPAGLLSIASDSEKELTAWHLLNEYVLTQNPRGRIFIIHRLDKDTSGVLIAAKNEEIKLLLQENWNHYALRRGYVAVVEGHLEEKEGVIVSNLKENSIHKVYTTTGVGGKEAITEYKVMREGKEYSLVSLSLKTGRKNQIRVHMSEKGCPVAGDKKYGAKTNPLKRLSLHADVLVIRHPRTGKVITFKANVPRRFAGLVKHDN